MNETTQGGALLSVDELSVRTSGAQGERTLINAISFSVGVERVGLVGESGSGKSLTARALLGLLKPPLEVAAARFDYLGQDLRTATPRQWASVRGSEIALVLQDPRHALNPVLTVARQLDEGLRSLRGEGKAERRDRIAAMLEAVGLREPQRVMRAYPHQLSGGMGQRVMLAACSLPTNRLRHWMLRCATRCWS
jgi:peptide/nickel transport system ATP-binding protein